ncbi:hypothetical protein AB0H71_13865 [Nocardia sp. NPDC050697]|uniref:hypothetical protein n=1 Tax=Nocardia sp. NPDC050697 TaxID=3155158 RepID=UPI0033ECD1A4
MSRAGEQIRNARELDRLQPAQAVIDRGWSGAYGSGAVIRDATGRVFQRDMDNLDQEIARHWSAGWWETGSSDDGIDSKSLQYPVTVLWMPEGDPW